MSSDPELKPATSEVQPTPAQKLDRYIASLTDRYDFDIMEDRMNFLIVKRSPDATHSEPWPDNGWMLTTTGVDKNGVTVGIVEKLLDPNDEVPARKKVVLAEAFDYSAEMSKARAPQVELADRALSITGPARPETVEPFNDPFSNAISGAEAAAVISHAKQPESQVELPAKETEREMLDRHVREYQDELSDLYAEHRKYKPQSDEALQLEHQIRLTKEDIGRVDRQRRNLR